MTVTHGVLRAGQAAAIADLCAEHDFAAMIITWPTAIGQRGITATPPSSRDERAWIIDRLGTTEQITRAEAMRRSNHQHHTQLGGPPPCT